MQKTKSVADKIREVMDLNEPMGDRIYGMLENILKEHPELETKQPRELSVDERYAYLRARGDTKILNSGISGYGPGDTERALADQHLFLDGRGAPRMTYDT